MTTKREVEASTHNAAGSAPGGIQGIADQHPAKVREGIKSCHNCGLPNSAISRSGITLRLRLKAEGPFRHCDRRLTVWCCGQDCAWQALAVAVMGLPTHKWPIRFREFCSLNPDLLKQSEVRSDCNETPTSEPHKQRGCEGAKPKSEPLPSPLGFVTRQGGRPRIHKDGAARVRAHRAQRRQRADTRESLSIAGAHE
jgi:hypothetical protein